MDREEIIKQLNNLGVETIAAYLGIRGKTTGLKFVGHCPFHEDRNPSFSFYTANDGNLRAKCFAGCFDGNMIDLFMRFWFGSINESYFLDTIKRLQSEGIISGDNYKKNNPSYKPQIQSKIPQPIENTNQIKKVDPGEPKGLSKEDMFRIWDYCSKLKQNSCINYLKSRCLDGIGEGEAGLVYWSGYLPENLKLLWEHLKAWYKKPGILIPYWYGKEIIGLQLRVLNPDKCSKYLFPKGQRTNFIWHLDGLEGKAEIDSMNYKEGQSVIITEGVFDALSCFQIWSNCFPIALVSANVREEKVIIDLTKLLIKRNVPKVFIAGDKDKGKNGGAGQIMNKAIYLIIKEQNYKGIIQQLNNKDVDNCNDINEFLMKKRGCKQ